MYMSIVKALESSDMDRTAHLFSTSVSFKTDSPPPFKSLSIHCNFEEHNFGNISQYHRVGSRSVTFLVRRGGDDLVRLWVQEFVLYEQAFGSHSGFLAWKNPWTEEPGRLLSIGSRESNLKQLNPPAAAGFPGREYVCQRKMSLTGVCQIGVGKNMKEEI